MHNSACIVEILTKVTGVYFFVQPLTDRFFAVAIPRVWNIMLPTLLRLVDTGFRHLLRAHC